MHADFVNGWDQQVLEDAVQQCTGDIGGVLTSTYPFSGLRQLFTKYFGHVSSPDCPPFIPYLDNDIANSCSTPSVVEENINGPLTALPGCNPIPTQQGAQCPNVTIPAIKGLATNDTLMNDTASSSTVNTFQSGTTLPLSTIETSIASSSSVSAGRSQTSQSPGMCFFYIMLGWI